MLEINKARAYQLSGTVTLKNILNEAYFILDSATGKQYDLTEMEYDIVSLIDSGAVFTEVVAQIASEYSAPMEQITADLEEYFASLLNAGIIIES